MSSVSNQRTTGVRKTELPLFFTPLTGARETSRLLYSVTPIVNRGVVIRCPEHTRETDS